MLQSSHRQFPLAKFGSKLSISCQVIFTTSHSQCFQQWWFPKGPNIWLLQGEVGGWVWEISEKNLLHTDLREKIFLQGNTWGKNILHWKKYLSRPIILQCYMLGKKIPSPEIWGKKSLTTGGSSITNNSMIFRVNTTRDISKLSQISLT